MLPRHYDEKSDRIGFIPVMIIPYGSTLASRKPQGSILPEKENVTFRIVCFAQCQPFRTKCTDDNDPRAPRGQRTGALPFRKQFNYN